MTIEEKGTRTIGNYNWSNKTILIVEDDEVNIFYLEEILYDTKVKIIVTKNGLEAVKICEINNNIDLVLMDIRIPGIDGYEATRRIKDINQDLPVISQTAYAMTEDEEKSKNAGCDAYISKPFDKNEIVLLMSKYI